MKRLFAFLPVLFPVLLNAQNEPARPSSSYHPFTIIRAGEYQCFFIDKAGALYGLGNIRTIGTGGKGTPGLLSPILPELKFTGAAGALHGGAAWDEDGNVYIVGDNSQGQYGNGTTVSNLDANKIETDSNGRPFTGISSMAAFFTGHENNGFYAIKKDGSLWVWGATMGGMRADGSSGQINTRPVQVPIPGNRKAKQIAAGYILVLLCTDGTVWTCGGSNPNFQDLGYKAGANDYLSLHQLDLTGIAQIAGGGSFNYAFKPARSGGKDSLFGWGFFGNYMGDSSNMARYGSPKYLKNILSALPAPIKKISCNSACTHVILQNGQLYGWGDNAQGTIGNGHELDYSKTKNPYSWDFRKGGLLEILPVRITRRSDFADISGSSPYTFYVYAVTRDNTIYAWGRNKGNVIANGVVACSSQENAKFPNSWDVPAPTVVNPFSLAKTTIVPSPFCVANPTTAPCNQCKLLKKADTANDK